MQQQETIQDGVDQVATGIVGANRGHEGSRLMLDNAMNADGQEGGIAGGIESSEEPGAGVNCASYSRTK